MTFLFSDRFLREFKREMQSQTTGANDTKMRFASDEDRDAWVRARLSEDDFEEWQRLKAQAQAQVEDEDYEDEVEFDSIEDVEPLEEGRMSRDELVAGLNQAMAQRAHDREDYAARFPDAGRIRNIAMDRVAGGPSDPKLTFIPRPRNGDRNR